MVAAVLQVLGWAAFFAAGLLWPAGTADYPGAWVFIAFFVFGGSAITIWMACHSPELLRERLAAPVQREQEPWDRVFLVTFILLFIGWLPLMSWDTGRTGFKAVPVWLQIVGAGCLLVYGLGAWWALRENAFAAPVIKIQKAQRLVDTGPYSIVRHPLYASALFLFIGIPLLLSSLLGIAGSAVFIAGLAWRAVKEERSLLRTLPGYGAYLLRVHWRFMPGIW